jgi:N6-adenosine-specific RNA methylase IME4
MQGFRYVTNLVWNKERQGDARGAGYWFTGEHELVLVGVRGKVVPPAVAHFRSNFSAPVGDHSEKPGNIHEIIEFHWPNVP